MSSSSLAVESLSFPARGITEHTSPHAQNTACAPVLCKELRLEVLPGLLLFVDGLLMNVWGADNQSLNHCVCGAGFPSFDGALFRHGVEELLARQAT